MGKDQRTGGALNLFAAFDTRRGHVYAPTAPRRRQIEFIAFLAQLDRDIPLTPTTIHLVLDNVRMHTGAVVRAWLTAPPRFCCYFPPVHCSWMNQVEIELSVLSRQRPLWRRCIGRWLPGKSSVIGPVSASTGASPPSMRASS